MDLLLPAFQLLYFILHFLYSLGQAVYECCLELYFLLCQTLWFKKMYCPQSQKVMADLSIMKKVPLHLAFIFMPKQVHSFEKVFLAVNWGASYGIKHFSFYDSKGILKQKLNYILCLLKKLVPDINVTLLVDGEEYCMGDSVTDVLRVCKKRDKKIEEQSAFCVTINLLSQEDGQNNLADVTKLLVKSTNTIDSEAVSSFLRTKGQPDPDLALVLGNPLSACGFLPWQTRLTEFIGLSSVSHCDYEQFHKVIQIYSKCEQRVGR